MRTRQDSNLEPTDEESLENTVTALLSIKCTPRDNHRQFALGVLDMRLEIIQGAEEGMSTESVLQGIIPRKLSGL